MAGATSITDAPYPTGENSVVSVRIGGYAIASGGAGTIVDTFVLPWDATIVGVDRSVESPGGTFPDDLTLKTVDSTALTIVADLAAPTQISGVAQTLHADVVGTNIVKGNKIQMTIDTAGGEDAIMYDTVHLRPTYG